MSVLLADILPGLSSTNNQSESELVNNWQELSAEYPWYPMPWLALAKTGNSQAIAKSLLWVENELQLNWMLNATPAKEDSWLLETNAEDKIGETTLETTLIEPEKELKPEDIYITHVPDNENIEIFSDNEPTNPKISVEPAVTIPAQEPEALASVTINDKIVVTESEPALVELPSAQPLPAIEQENTGIITTPEETLAAEQTPDVKEAESEVAPVKQPIAAPVKDISPDNNATTSEEAGAEKLAFEPFHVVDYFASQGIKVDVNAIPKTQLDRQMKSFTQWLKTMKRLTPQENVAPDPLVDAHANASNAKKEIITEAMVEVLEKQAKYKQAVETLEKLILLHPEKSIFFANRINEIKSKQ